MSMQSTYSGNVTLYSSHDSFPGPKVEEGVEFVLLFADGLATLRVESFKPVVIDDIDTPLGRRKLTAGMVGNGSGSLDPASGTMRIDVVFRFRLDSPLLAPSLLRLAVSTESAQMPAGDTVSGQPLEPASGRLRLVAVSEFEGGFLDTVRCGVILQGVLAPPPT